MEYAIKELWPIILAMVGFIVWLVRLENKVRQNEVEIKEVKDEKNNEGKNVNSKLDDLNRTLTSLCIDFADLSGYIRRCNEEKNEKH